MSRTFAINSNNDFVVDRTNSLVVSRGQLAMADMCKNAIQDQLGEMIYNMTNGMPTIATVWDSYSPMQFEAAARVTLAAVPDVVAIDSFVVAAEGTTLRYEATIRTIHGSVNING